PGHDELEDRVRDAEGGEVGVELAARPELRSDDEEPDPAQEAAGEGRDGQDEAGGGGSAAGRAAVAGRRRWFGRGRRLRRLLLLSRHRPARSRAPRAARGCASRYTLRSAASDRWV